MAMTQEDHEEHEQHKPFAWNGAELQALLLGLALIVVWVLATVLFGFAGLITVAVAFVAVLFAVLVMISRG